MTTPLELVKAEVSAATRTACRLGFPVAIALAFVTALAFGLGIVTPVRSGPYCTGLCMAYPYAEAGAFFPRDYLWMPAAMLIAPLFTVLVACLHFCVPVGAKPLTLLALCFASIGTAVLASDYFVQMLVVQSSLAHRELDGVALLTQYNPRGLFIALEDLGYLLIAVAFLPIAAAIPRSLRAGAALRWTLAVAFVLALIAFVSMALLFGLEMGLPFELAIISIVWIGLVVAGIESSLLFRQAARANFIV